MVVAAFFSATWLARLLNRYMKEIWWRVVVLSSKYLNKLIYFIICGPIKLLIMKINNYQI